jgi:hypothetical protein
MSIELIVMMIVEKITNDVEKGCEILVEVFSRLSHHLYSPFLHSLEAAPQHNQTQRKG